MEDTEETTNDGVHPNQRKGVAKEDREQRLERIDELVYEGLTTHKIAQLIASEHKIAIRTAYQDIREAAERRAPDEEAARMSLQERAAAHWKYREQVAERAGKLNDANYAFDRWCKVKGAFSPKKVEITGSIGVSVQMRAVLAVLDADGKAALELVLRQLDAAKAAGKLVEAPEPAKALKP